MTTAMGEGSQAVRKCCGGKPNAEPSGDRGNDAEEIPADRGDDAEKNKGPPSYNGDPLLPGSGRPHLNEKAAQHRGWTAPA